MSIEEKAKQVVGTAKEGLGKLVGDAELKAEGTTEKVVNSQSKF